MAKSIDPDLTLIQELSDLGPLFAQTCQSHYFRTIMIAIQNLIAYFETTYKEIIFPLLRAISSFNGFYSFLDEIVMDTSFRVLCK